MVGSCRSVVRGGGRMVGSRVVGGFGVSLSLVLDVGNVSTVAIHIGSVGDGLDAAVGQVDGVGALPQAGAVVRLGLLEGGAGVVVRHGVLVGVGGDLRQVVVADAVRDSMTDHTMADHTMTNEPMADTTMAH